MYKTYTGSSTTFRGIVPPNRQRGGRAHGDLTHTWNLSESLVRLPLWIGLEELQPGVGQTAIPAAMLEHAS